MAKMCLSKPSKRLTCRKRYKIEKKVKEHNRKLRKENKKKQNKVNRKPIVVPNVCPFKDKILAEVEALKAQQEEEREKKRAEMRELRMKQKEGEMSGGLQGLVENAETRRLLHEQANNFGIGPGLFTDITAKTFYKEFKKVVSRADVILEVLDARDPLGTRCLAVEREIMRNPGKRLVIVLNKADLVPRDVLQSWLKYLRRSFPAVPFKASTQEQGSRLGRRGGRKGKMSASLSQAELEGSPCVGAELLLSLLGNYCRSKDIKTSIVVGVVGIPNVGKSSLINSLKRCRACNVGALPGITKTLQQVQLDSRLKLLDCPGIVFASGDMSDGSIALKNALRLDNLQDVYGPAEAILKRANKEQLRQIYKIEEDFATTDEFLTLMAKAMGRYKKGGVTDTRAVARVLIQDWNMGKIKYYVLPPEEKDAEEVHISAEIVQEHAKEFDMSQLTKLEKEAMTDFVKIAPQEAMVIESEGPVVPLVEEQASKPVSEAMEDSESEDDEEPPQLVEAPELLSERVEVVGKRKRPKKGGTKDSKKEDPTMSLEGNLKLGKVKKVQFKKMKKDRKRQNRLADKLKKVGISDA